MERENLVSKDVSKPCATDQSSTFGCRPENDLFEFVEESGQIAMQGQSSRARRSPTSKIRDKDVGNAANTAMRKFGDLDSGLNEIPMSVPSGEVDLSPDEGMASWLNYTIDDFLQHDYNSEFLHGLTGDTINEIPASDNYYLRDKRHNYDREFRDCHRSPLRDVSSSEQGIVSRGFSVGEVETSRTKASTNQLYLPSSRQCLASLTSIRSRVSDITENSPRSAPQHSHSKEIIEVPSTSGGFSSLKMHKHDPITTSTSSTSTIINFSHFAKPAAIARANLQSMGKMSGLSSARSESMLHMKKGAAATSSNPPASTFSISRSEHPRESNMHCQQELGSFKSDLKMLELTSLEQKGPTSEQLDHACKNDTFTDDQTSDQVLAESGNKGHTTVEKSIEQAVASSSVCSGDGAEMFSDNSNQNLKRKSRDTEGSECHSEDVEEESGFFRRAAPARGGTGSKRSRAAEVHNLSERRRRDRINEKMRALQELIPNCNKVDKASMLDEAIEYLKTLQLQVQIMSMGAGLYVPPMMLPHGMQNLHSPVSTFPPMSGCMPLGLGMGYAMGMPDMSSGSSRIPMIQVPQMQGTHLSVPSMFGHCGPIPMPRAPLPVHPLSETPLMNPSASGLNASGTAGIMHDMDSVSASGLKGPLPNVNSQLMQGTGGSNPIGEMSTQCEATSVGLEELDFAHNSGHDPDGDDKGVVNPGRSG